MKKNKNEIEETELFFQPSQEYINAINIIRKLRRKLGIL